MYTKIFSSNKREVIWIGHCRVQLKKKKKGGAKFIPSHFTQKTVGTVTGNKNVISITSNIGEESTCLVCVCEGGRVYAKSLNT